MTDAEPPGVGEISWMDLTVADARDPAGAVTALYQPLV
jgi:hypothetical protein